MTQPTVSVSQIFPSIEKNPPPHLRNLCLQRGLTPEARKRVTLFIFSISSYAFMSGPSLKKLRQATLSSTFERQLLVVRQKSQNASQLICLTTGLEQSWRWIKSTLVAYYCRSNWQFDNDSSNRTARPHSWHCLNFSFTVSDVESVNVFRATAARLW